MRLVTDSLLRSHWVVLSKVAVRSSTASAHCPWIAPSAINFKITWNNKTKHWIWNRTKWFHIHSSEQPLCKLCATPEVPKLQFWTQCRLFLSPFDWWLFYFFQENLKTSIIWKCEGSRRFWEKPKIRINQEIHTRVLNWAQCTNTRNAHTALG